MSKLIVQSFTPKVGNIITLESGNSFLNLPAQPFLRSNSVRTEIQTTYSAPASGNGTTISALNVSITPTSTDSMLWMKWMLSGEIGQDCVFLIHRNGNLITDTGYEAYNATVGNQRYSGVVSGWYDNDNNSTQANWCIHHFVRANSTEPLIFSPAVRASSGTALTFYLNRAVGSAEITLSSGAIYELANNTYTYSLT